MRRRRYQASPTRRAEQRERLIVNAAKRDVASTAAVAAQAVGSIDQVLGADPQGAYADLAERLDAIESQLPLSP